MFPRRKPFDKTDWYFVVGSDIENVFSSAQAKVVPTTDNSYVQWKATGGIPQPVQSYSDLYDFLEREGMLSTAILTALNEINGLTATQKYAALLASGLTITSTSSPDIVGHYVITDATQFDIMGLVLGILAGQGFPGGVDKFPWADAAGNTHLFTPDEFVLFATAVRDYVAAVRAAAASIGPNVAWPSATVAIP